MDNTIENTVNVTCFIVPNAVVRFKSCYSKDLCETQLKTLGITPHPEDPCFQTWFSSDLCDNHSVHGWGEELCSILGVEFDPKHPTYMKYSAPNILPYNILWDVKEGDIKEFTAPSGAKIRVKFEQLPYRYGRYGKFEEVIEHLYEDFRRKKK